MYPPPLSDCKKSRCNRGERRSTTNSNVAWYIRNIRETSGRSRDFRAEHSRDLNFRATQTSGRVRLRSRTLSLHFCVENPFCDVHVRGRLGEAKENMFCENSFCEKLFCVEKLFCEKLFCEQLFCAEKSFCEKLFCVEKFVLRDVRLRPLSLACSSGAKVRTKPSFDSGGGCASQGRRQCAVNPGDCQQFQGAEVLSGREMIEGGTTEPCFGFGRPNLRDVVPLNGPSNLLTANSSSEHK